MIRPTIAYIDLSALAHNYRALRAALGQRVGVIAVVKADAYGHGAVPVARLLEGLGIRGLGVATVEEAVELRDGGIKSPIMVMGAAFGSQHRTVIDYQLTPVVGDAIDVPLFATAAAAVGQDRFSIHIKVDTGMARLGVTTDKFEAFMRACANHASIRVDGLATHFACAEEVDDKTTSHQLQKFIDCLHCAQKMGADPQWIHAANSAACLRFTNTHFDLVRPGIVLYGVMPSQSMVPLSLKPVLTWQSRINALRHVPVGSPVSYGGTFVTTRPSVIATIPVGYADGYRRQLSNRAQVVVRQQRANVVGTVCMDLTMIDVTDIPGVAVGDVVNLLGGGDACAVTPWELAQWAETIPYEIFVGISKRVPRSYVE